MLIRTGLAFLFAVTLITAANATIFNFTVNWQGGGPIETFAIDTSAGLIDGAGPHYVLYDTIDDSFGAAGVFFGDDAVLGYFGTGPILPSKKFPQA
jgi:hypothetical protein